MPMAVENKDLGELAGWRSSEVLAELPAEPTDDDADVQVPEEVWALLH